MSNCERYDAFISYRHLMPDMIIAEKLQDMLERYRPPFFTECKRTKRIKRVFRDKSELPTSGNLGNDLKNALENSEFLIVICSPELKNSKWCMEEIEYFKQLHGGSTRNILTLLVDGSPGESIPDSLRESITSYSGSTDGSFTVTEPLAANVSEAVSLKEKLKKLKTEFLRIAAPILGCSFDELYRRHLRRTVISLVRNISFFVILTLASVGILHYRNAELKRMAEQSAYDTNVIYLNAAEKIINDGDRLKGIAILTELIDLSADKDGYVQSEYERLLSKAAYVPQYGQYGILYTDGTAMDVVFYEDRIIAAHGSCVSVFDKGNGQLLDSFVMSREILKFGIDNGTLYILEQNGKIEVLNLTSGKAEAEFSLDELSDCISVFDFDVYNGKLAVLYNTKSNKTHLTVFDCGNAASHTVSDGIVNLLAGYGRRTEIQYFDDGRLLVPEADKISFFDFEAMEKVVITEISGDYIHCLARESGNGSTELIIIISQTEFAIYDTQTQAVRTVPYCDEESANKLSVVDISPGERFMCFTSYREGFCSIYDFESGKVYHLGNADLSYGTDSLFISDREILVCRGTGSGSISVYRYDERFSGFVYYGELDTGNADISGTYYDKDCFILTSGGKMLMYSSKEAFCEEESDFSEIYPYYYDYMYCNPDKGVALIPDNGEIKFTDLTDGSVKYSYKSDKCFVYAVNPGIDRALCLENGRYILVDSKSRTAKELENFDYSNFDAVQLTDSGNFLALKVKCVFEVNPDDGSEVQICTLESDFAGAAIWSIKADRENDRLILSHTYQGNQLDTSTYIFKLSTGKKLFCDKGFYLSGYKLNSFYTGCDYIYYENNIFDKRLIIPTYEEILETAVGMIGDRRLTPEEIHGLGE